jgi:hypothetical protein
VPESRASGNPGWNSASFDPCLTRIQLRQFPEFRINMTGQPIHVQNQSAVWPTKPVFFGHSRNRRLTRDNRPQRFKLPATVKNRNHQHNKIPLIPAICALSDFSDANHSSLNLAVGPECELQWPPQARKSTPGVMKERLIWRFACFSSGRTPQIPGFWSASRHNSCEFSATRGTF